ncbi:MAG: hypothetical protein A2355_07610 [Spirochaetes bacterium RIFOXYB1_FULL_32_8]|nr:MAG: hypothetical protein A2355_07610 [Spirochaetes bacterium RIFOXYB1_FULL_32_8]
MHIKFVVKHHNYFVREGYDLKLHIPISYTQAALGDEINVKTIDSKTIKIKIPAGCENGKVLRIKNAGIEYLESAGRKGDLFIQVFVDVPSKISKEEKMILEKLREIKPEVLTPTPMKIDTY